MNIGEGCNREVVIIRREEPILDAVKLMRSYHVGDVVVVDERDGQRFPVGILTDRDIVVELLADDVDLKAVTVGEVMGLELLTAREEDDIWDTVKRMRERGVRRIPVVNKHGGLEGILTEDDLIELLREFVNDLVSLVASEKRHEEQTRP